MEIMQIINKMSNPTFEVDYNKYTDEQLKSIICKQLFLKKYRKYKISEEVVNQIKEQVTYIIDNKLPFIFTPAFGGYKHFWTDSYPYTDWAEIFNLNFLFEYLRPIIEHYKYGVVIEYESEEIIIEKINNMPQSSLNEYTNCWKEIIKYYNGLLPKNVKLKYTLASETYTKEQLYKEMNKRYTKFTKLFDTYDDKDYRLSKASTNIMWNGKENLEKLTEEEKKEFIKESRILDETFLDTDFDLRKDFFFTKNRILICFSFGLWPEGAEAIHIGSCSTSMVDFWTGIGILEVRDDSTKPRIISKKQYETIKDKLEEIPLENAVFENIGINYKTIYVYRGQLNF